MAEKSDPKTFAELAQQLAENAKRRDERMDELLDQLAELNAKAAERSPLLKAFRAIMKLFKE